MPLPVRQGLNRPTQPHCSVLPLRLLQKQNMLGQADALFLRNFILAPSQLYYQSTLKILAFTTGMEVRFQCILLPEPTPKHKFFVCFRKCFMVGACTHGRLLHLCLILCNPMDCSPPGSSIYGIPQTRILEWVAMPFSKGSFLTQESNLHLLCLLHWQVDSFTTGAAWEACFMVGCHSNSYSHKVVFIYTTH